MAAVAPHLKITVDFTAHYKTGAKFLPIGRGLDGAGNMLVTENPIDKSDMAGYRELRTKLKTPLALHLGDPGAMIRGIGEDACAIFNTVPAPSMSSFISNCYLAGAAGLLAWHGSGHEFGDSGRRQLHSCAAAVNCTLPSDILSYASTI